MSGRRLLPRFTLRNIILILTDVLLINLSVYVALLLRLDGLMEAQYIKAFMALIPLFSILGIIFNIASRLYDRVWEYASLHEMFAIGRAVTYTMAAAVIFIYLLDLPHLPRTVYVISWVLMFGSIGASRLVWRLARGRLGLADGEPPRRILIVGAGDAGAILQQELEHNHMLGMKAVAFIDDNAKKKGSLLHGVPVIGGRHRIGTVVREMDIDEIIIAMPSVSGRAIRPILDECKKTGASVRILPGVYKNASEMVRGLRPVEMEDLLRREPVQLDMKSMVGYIAGKTVLVTGAGGSIGSELCRQLALIRPERLVMIDNCENNLFDIETELKQAYDNIVPMLTDVRREDELKVVFERYRPQVIFHAAAYKHVPMMERHPEAAFENNVMGTRNVARLADIFAAETFILVSTDKAVNPTSVMGATKRLAELVVKDAANSSATTFAAVRFGNVLGSRGSVIPVFMKQIAAGGPVTVTDPEMRRYFMTIPEAVQLIIQAGALATGGEVFVLDMGEMVKIDDLARDLIRLSGLEPNRDIQIVYTGIRPGEKLYEELFADTEGLQDTSHQRIFVYKKDAADGAKDIAATLHESYAQGVSAEAVIDIIRQFIPEYKGADRTMPLI
ncbi:MAG: nucleoside-diphosphate sugar epimerase/dehydratase [Syntrophomonadaceae bacterium]|nr:nucleoside-diphosphate sugar epimerase/dehydratase [Syntrophomonadaceae bacterium]